MDVARKVFETFGVVSNVEIVSSIGNTGTACASSLCSIEETPDCYCVRVLSMPTLTVPDPSAHLHFSVAVQYRSYEGFVTALASLHNRKLYFKNGDRELQVR